MIQKTISFYKKSGQIDGTVSTVIALIVGVGISVLVLIFVGIMGGQAYTVSQSQIDEIGNNIVTRDTFTVINNTYVQLDHGFVQQGSLSIFNATGKMHEWGLSNFTIDYDAGLVKLIGIGTTGTMPFNMTTLGANYTWGANEIRSSVKSGIASSFSALEDTGSYLPLIVLGIIIFLILGLVLGMTLLAGKGGGRNTAL